MNSQIDLLPIWTLEHNLMRQRPAALTLLGMVAEPKGETIVGDI